VIRDSESVLHVYRRLEVCTSILDFDANLTFQYQHLELPHHLTSTGLLFAALSPDAVSFETFFPGLEALLDKFDFTTLPHRRSIAYEGNFNWKTM
jgi:hypothetical protein